MVGSRTGLTCKLTSAGRAILVAKASSRRHPRTFRRHGRRFLHHTRAFRGVRIQEDPADPQEARKDRTRGRGRRRRRRKPVSSARRGTRRRQRRGSKGLQPRLAGCQGARRRRYHRQDRVRPRQDRHVRAFGQAFRIWVTERVQGSALCRQTGDVSMEAKVSESSNPEER